ncbi:MAG: galactokinase, partial [Opitutales bacterium]
METLIKQARAAFNRQFGAEAEAVGVAPGRLEFIGNHCDYNGGLVMGVAIDRRVGVAVGRRGDGRIELVSEGCSSASVADAAKVDRLEGKAAWGNYALGVWTMLRANGMTLPGGFNLAVVTDLPLGAGMSSSAAFELATAQALSALGGADRSPGYLARLCRRAENEFVGMPCGILDQGVSAFGRENQIVQIDCLTETFSRLPLPPEAQFRVFNTNVK